MSLDTVRTQYELYPYPARNPQDERRRLITGSPSHILEINHYLFAGGRDFSQPFRALVAGGGTGDGAIMLAQQLADHGTGGQVVYLDLSEAARDIAVARAKVRGLTNITFLTGSLLDLPRLELGRFDYIDCCGVLHHLEDPAQGLRVLAEALEPDSGMGLMLYGAYGRRGVYETQDMLRVLSADLPLAERIDLARGLLEALPPTNWMKRNPFLGDHKASDAELVDLLLHSQDRAFSVGEIAELVTDAGLRVASFIEPARYDPVSYLRDPKILARMVNWSPLARAAFAECLAGNMKRHVVYVTTAGGETVAQLEDPEFIPCYRELNGEKLAAALQRDDLLKTEFDGIPLHFALPRLSATIAGRIDGVRSIGGIYAALRKLDPSLEWERFDARFTAFYGVLSGLNHLLLKRPRETSGTQ